MNKFVIIASLCFFGQLISAQNTDGNYLISNSKPVKIKGYIGPVFKFANLIEDFSYYAGASGGMIINDQLELGMTAGGFVNESIWKSENNYGREALLNTAMFYGGFHINYRKKKKKNIQLSFPTVVGAGGIFYFDQIHDPSGWVYEEMVEGGAFLVFEPAIGLELKVSRMFMAGISAGYRTIFHSDLERLTDQDLSDFTLGISFKVGSF